jgi:NodT family efflux transporter outer membrane factor (OMF) lipoprotein
MNRPDRTTGHARADHPDLCPAALGRVAVASHANWHLLLAICLLFLSDCSKIGPDFVRPVATVSSNWLDADDNRLSSEIADYREWWRTFNDPVLDQLINTAYRQNLSLRIAGVRVLEARAQLGIVVGSLYPQTQQAYGYTRYSRLSDKSSQSEVIGNLQYGQAEIGLSAGWELDFWGRFRRAVESADERLMATVADYDSVLVSLTADTAASYILMRTIEKRIEIAQQSVDTQIENLRIAEARFQEGSASERDVDLAKTLLGDSQATIPTLMSLLRQVRNSLSVLMGLPPGDLKDILGGPSSIPVPPVRIAVGIPADLIRRRPDIRSAEHQAAAQSAQIGVAKADLFPALSISGNFGFLSTNVGRSSLNDIFRWGSRRYDWGPSFQWNILNYGRLANNVRVQDARFQELIIAYQSALLRAQQEVEDSLSAFLRAQERAAFLAASTDSAKRFLDLAVAQYREGATDFTNVLIAQQALLNVQGNLVNTLGDISGNLVAVYRALGGGWEIREGSDLVPKEIKEVMAGRTNWGDLLEPAVYMPPPSEHSRHPVPFPDW